MAEQMVTWWVPGFGYCRELASPEYEAMVVAETENDHPAAVAQAFHVFGWEEIDGSDDDAMPELNLKVYQHQRTGDRFLNLWNVSQCLAQVHVRAENCDIFMMTEYLRIRQQAEAVNASDEFLMLKKAQVSFIRYGHGKSTVSEFGTTRDEADDRASARRAREEAAAVG